MSSFIHFYLRLASNALKVFKVWSTFLHQPSTLPVFLSFTLHSNCSVPSLPMAKFYIILPCKSNYSRISHFIILHISLISHTTLLSFPICYWYASISGLWCVPTTLKWQNLRCPLCGSRSGFRGINLELTVNYHFCMILNLKKVPLWKIHKT